MSSGRQDLHVTSHARRVAMHDALQRLTPRHQQVIAFKFFHHLSTADIAIVLQCSETNVQALQQQALVELLGWLSTPI